jgi:hypothetical protein
MTLSLPNAILRAVFYWFEEKTSGKTHPAGLITVQDASSDRSEGKNYGYMIFGSISKILECQLFLPEDSGRRTDCGSKERFDELTSQYFGIDRHLRGPAGQVFSEIKHNWNWTLPPNTKISASAPYLEFASEDEIVEDLTYCHQNPNNNLHRGYWG